MNSPGIMLYYISSPISWVIFSVFDKKFGIFFHEKWGLAYSRGFRIKKQSSIENVLLIQNDLKFHDCSALYMTCFKIVMTTMYFWPPIRFFASHILLCFCSHVVVFTSSLICFFFFCVYFNSLAFVVSKSFPNVFHEVRSLKWPGTIKNFAFGLQPMVFLFLFFFGQHESVGRSLTFRVLAYRWRSTVTFFFTLWSKHLVG